MMERKREGIGKGYRGKGMESKEVVKES